MRPVGGRMGSWRVVETNGRKEWMEVETKWRNGRIVRTKGGTEDHEEERN